MKRASQIDEAYAKAYAAHPIDEPDEYDLLEISTAHPYPVPAEVAELRAELDLARQRAELLEANLRDVRQALEVLSRALPPG